MNQISQEEIEVTIANAQRPRSNSNYQFPLNDLDDRIFEILTYSIYKKLIDSNQTEFSKKYDQVHLMQGVGEKGMDCTLIKEGVINGVIQCKKYASNISDIQFLKELIKFSIHIISETISISEQFTYNLATSKGYTGKAIALPVKLKNGTFIKEYEIQSITESVIRNVKEFKGIGFKNIQNQLIETIKGFDYNLIRPEDYSLWINDYPAIIETFFEIKKVTDNTLIEKKSKEIIDVVKDLFPNNEASSITKLIESYKNVAKEKLNIVNFIGFDIHRHRQRPTDIALTDLFVQPAFTQRTVDKNEKIHTSNTQELRIANIFKSEKNIVILGHPGAGKSLLVKHIILQLLENKSENIGIRQYSNYLPLRIELRKYNEVVEQKSIITHLSDILQREYLTNISANQIEKILDNSCTLIFFDGLDEIFNITHKTKMKEYIEAFSNRFPLCKCVITSRFIGYHDIKFSSKNFDEFAIMSFDRGKVKELVNKFYTTQYPSLEKRKLYIENCQRQLDDDVDDELKSNPLILTLILILASNNIIIPDSKLEIYEACTKTLVDSLDLREKELTIEIPVKNKSLAFAHLAYNQYELMSKNIEISHQRAVQIIANMLSQKKECIDHSEAENIANKFLEYAERRSIYFENNFTHKTFLEYFTAEYLYSNCIAKASDAGRNALHETVSNYLSNSFWYIVFELLFTRIDKVQPDNELLDEVFSKQLNSTSLDVFYFLISNITRINNVSQHIKKKIIKNTILLCIKGEKLTGDITRTGFYWESSLVSKIAKLEEQNDLFMLLKDTFKDLEDGILSEKQTIELYNLYYEINWIQRRINHMNGERNVKIEKIKYGNYDIAKNLSYKDLLLFSNVHISRRGNFSEKLPINILVNQIEHFGIKTLFTHIPLRYISSVRQIPTFDLYLISILEMSDFQSFKADLEVLQKHGLDFEKIMDHVKKNQLVYFIRSQKLEKVLTLYLKSDDVRIDTLLLKLIRKDNELKIAYEKFKAENQSVKLKNVDKIFEKRLN